MSIFICDFSISLVCHKKSYVDSFCSRPIFRYCVGDLRYEVLIPVLFDILLDLNVASGECSVIASALPMSSFKGCSLFADLVVSG